MRRPRRTAEKWEVKVERGLYVVRVTFPTSRRRSETTWPSCVSSTAHLGASESRPLPYPRGACRAMNQLHALIIGVGEYPYLKRRKGTRETLGLAPLESTCSAAYAIARVRSSPASHPTSPWVRAACWSRPPRGSSRNGRNAGRTTCAPKFEVKPATLNNLLDFAKAWRHDAASYPATSPFSISPGTASTTPRKNNSCSSTTLETVSARSFDTRSRSETSWKACGRRPSSPGSRKSKSTPLTPVAINREDSATAA